jgi:phage-related protein
MATFPSITPAYNVVKKSTPKVRRVVFGDGYEMRFTEGLNTNAKSYDVSFQNISEANCDTIETFLDARAADAATFTWTPPGESAAKFVCESWNKTISYNNRATIRTTFRQVFEP